MHTESERDIKRRLEKEALKAWGHTETERMDLANTFDPLVSLLLGACSVEFGKVYREILASRNRVLSSVIELLAPEIYLRPRPAHAIMHARPKDTRAVLEKNHQFSVTTKTAEIFFTPATSVKLVDGDVKFLAFHNRILNVAQFPDRPVYLKAPKPLPPQDFWIGLEMKNQVETLAGLSFFWDWHEDTHKSDIYYQLLGLATWSVEGLPLKTKIGLPRKEVPAEYSPELAGFQEEYSITHKLEQDIVSTYQSRFITLEGFENAPDKKPIYDLKRGYPEAFEQYFRLPDLVPLNEDRLLWIKVSFPGAFPSEMLAKVDCLINCVPILNRRLVKQTKKLKENINILALDSQDFFLDIKSLQDSQGQSYHAIPLTNIRNYQSGTYTLRKEGVGRFDHRNAREMLSQLIDLLRDDSAAFAAFNKRDFLDSKILKLNQEISELEQFIKKDEHAEEAVPYLIVRPPRREETVFVEYWVSQGTAANQVAFGHPMNMSDVLPLEKNSLKLILSPISGCNRPNLEESLSQYKNAMLTRGRIVTHQDIKTYCTSFLGEHLKAIEVNKEVYLGELPHQGFIRVIRVKVFLTKQGMYDDKAWNERRQELEGKLNQYSTKVLPIQVEFIDQEQR